jgi:endonuclease YncB( thermonuclease family)
LNGYNGFGLVGLMATSVGGMSEAGPEDRWYQFSIRSVLLLQLFVAGLLAVCIYWAQWQSRRPPYRQSGRTQYPAASYFRQWTDTTGRYRVEAAFLSSNAGVVRLATADGIAILWPLDLLSAEDRQWLRKRSQLGPTSFNIITAKVVRVVNGDTIDVLEDDSTVRRVRLEGVDARDAFGADSRNALAEKVLQRDVRVKWSSKDGSDRLLGDVFVGNRWINGEMIEQGWARHDKAASASRTLAEAEVKARNAGAGLWARHHPPPVPPRTSVTEPALSPGPRWITTTDNVRHNGSCRFYRGGEGRFCNPKEGKPCRLCGG